MRVLAGLSLEGPAARQRDLLTQQAAPCGTGLVLSREVTAVGLAAYAVGRRLRGRLAVWSGTGTEGNGVKLAGNAGYKAGVHRGGGTFRRRLPAVAAGPTG
jgi:hypothetical protein